MATTGSFGYTDSITTQKQLSIPDLDWDTDFAIVKDSANELILTNITSPVDQPETFRFGYQTVANIYAGTGIDPSFMSVSKRGVSLVSQVNDIYRIQCTDENACVPVVIDLPYEAHLVVKVPISQYVTADLAMQIGKRAFAGIFDTGGVTSARLGAMMRQALKPSGL